MDKQYQTVINNLARLPLVCFSFFIITREFVPLRLLLGAHPYFGHDVTFIFSLLARISIIVFLVLFATLDLTRQRLASSYPEWTAKVTSLLNVLFIYFLVLLPREEPRFIWDIASVLLLLIGDVIYAQALIENWQAVGHLSQNEIQVGNGGCRWFSRQLFLGESVATFGLFLQLRSVIGLAILMIGFFWRWRRMVWSKAVLSKAFPDSDGDINRTTHLPSNAQWKRVFLFFGVVGLISILAVAAVQLVPQMQHYPELIFSAPDGENLRFILHGKSTVEECENSLSALKGSLTRSCSTCVREARCTDGLNAELNLLLSSTPIQTPSGRLASGVVLYSSKLEGQALLSCRQSEAATATLNQDQRLRCFPGGLVRQ